MKLSNHKLPTSAFITKLAAGVTGAGIAASAYAYTYQSPWMQVVGFILTTCGPLIAVFGK